MTCNLLGTMGGKLHHCKIMVYLGDQEVDSLSFAIYFSYLERQLYEFWMRIGQQAWIWLQSYLQFLKFDEYRNTLIHQDVNDFHLQLVLSQKWKKNSYIKQCLRMVSHSCLTLLKTKR